MNKTQYDKWIDKKIAEGGTEEQGYTKSVSTFKLPRRIRCVICKKLSLGGTKNGKVFHCFECQINGKEWRYLNGEC